MKPTANRIYCLPIGGFGELEKCTLSAVKGNYFTLTKGSILNLRSLLWHSDYYEMPERINRISYFFIF